MEKTCSSAAEKKFNYEKPYKMFREGMLIRELNNFNILINSGCIFSSLLFVGRLVIIYFFFCQFQRSMIVELLRKTIA